MRPQAVLEKALAHVVARAREGADYKAFVNGQLKSIRQDLVVSTHSHYQENGHLDSTLFLAVVAAAH